MIPFEFDFDRSRGKASSVSDTLIRTSRGSLFSNNHVIDLDKS